MALAVAAAAFDGHRVGGVIAMLLVAAIPACGVVWDVLGSQGGSTFDRWSSVVITARGTSVLAVVAAVFPPVSISGL